MDKENAVQIARNNIVAGTPRYDGLLKIRQISVLVKIKDKSNKTKVKDKSSVKLLVKCYMLGLKTQGNTNWQKHFYTVFKV